MQDNYGNYIALPVVPFPMPPLLTTAGTGMTLYGKGAPTGTPFPWQTFYVDQTAGTTYVNRAGVWTLH